MIYMKLRFNNNPRILLGIADEGWADWKRMSLDGALFANGERDR